MQDKPHPGKDEDPAGPALFLSPGQDGHRPSSVIGAWGRFLPDVRRTSSAHPLQWKGKHGGRTFRHEGHPAGDPGFATDYNFVICDNIFLSIAIPI
ncbi:hypothetical protein NJLHNGOC_00065 [Novacetimonas cocois]|uniref:Uncharacterized protein n=2 Tax=Novacetimonas cocois TaxID=1747507 RepID=A0A365Z0L3_9PROT|nr:hypothetical protein NJLHNGOC_00065 [Novacetimonas cocois]